MDLLIACVRKLGGEDLEVAGANTVDFTLVGIQGFARVQDGGRLRGSVLLDLDVPDVEMEEAFEWADQQDTRACRVDVFWHSGPETVGGVRLLFERDLDPESIAADDALASEAEEVFASWLGEEPPDAPVLRGRLHAVDPTGRPPTNAWLLMGGESSYFTPEDIGAMRQDAALGIYESVWTAAKQTEPGDLLFIYFTEPYKAIHFVARAVDHAFFDDVDTTGEEFSGRQWWTHVTPLVEIEPIALDTLKEVTGDMVMLGRSGRYLRPEHAASLAGGARALRSEDSHALAQVLQPVAGRAEHPDPASLDLRRWRQLASGSLALEADAERLIVEPLLRMVLGGQPDVTVSKAYRVGQRIVDYVVLDGGRPTCAIEVKLRVRRSRTADWEHCEDFLQAADYGQRLGVPAVLIDAFEIHLIPAGARQPALTLTRAVLLDDDLMTLRRHILGG